MRLSRHQTGRMLTALPANAFFLLRFQPTILSLPTSCRFRLFRRSGNRAPRPLKRLISRQTSPSSLLRTLGLTLQMDTCLKNHPVRVFRLDFTMLKSAANISSWSVRNTKRSCRSASIRKLAVRVGRQLVLSDLAQLRPACFSAKVSATCRTRFGRSGHSLLLGSLAYRSPPAQVSKADEYLTILDGVSRLSTV